MQTRQQELKEVTLRIDSQKPIWYGFEALEELRMIIEFLFVWSGNESILQMFSQMLILKIHI